MGSWPERERADTREPDRDSAPVESNKDRLLEYLMRRFGDRVFYLAYFYLGDRHYAQDVSQEVFLRVYAGLDHFRGDASYYTWIYKITRNLCLKQLRSWAWRKLFYTDDYNSLDGPSYSAEDQVLERLEREELCRKILELPLKYREILVLHYFHDLSVHEAAGVVGISPGYARVRLHRARNLLYRRMAKEEIRFGR